MSRFLMYRPEGVRAKFNSIEEGQKAGYFATLDELAADCARRFKERQAGVNTPAQGAPPAPPAPEPHTSNVPNTPAPPPPVLDADDDDDDDDMVIPVHDDLPPAPKRPLPDMELGEVKALAVEYGIDPTLHHMVLRKQVEEKLNAESGSD